MIRLEASEKELMEASMKLEMNRKEKVESFEDIGMSDPFDPKKSLKITIKNIESCGLFKRSYNKHFLTSVVHLLRDESVKAPACVFIPSR